jgi:hypothetical protein
MPLRQSVVVPLSPSTATALRELAERELRDPRLQARWLLEDGLRRARALPPEPAAPLTRNSGAQAAE